MAVQGVCVCNGGSEGCWGCVRPSMFDSYCLATRSPGNHVSLLSEVPKVRRDKSGPLSHFKTKLQVSHKQRPSEVLLGGCSPATQHCWSRFNGVCRIFMGKKGPCLRGVVCHNFCVASDASVFPFSPAEVCPSQRYVQMRIFTCRGPAPGRQCRALRTPQCTGCESPLPSRDGLGELERGQRARY